ncbi:MAG: hypothetical protein ACHBN1_11155 [Heteroscytonema crispum UTEX LB 1556]
MGCQLIAIADTTAIGNQHPTQAIKKTITTTITDASCKNDSNVFVDGSNKVIKTGNKNTTDYLHSIDFLLKDRKAFSLWEHFFTISSDAIASRATSTITHVLSFCLFLMKLHQN